MTATTNDAYTREQIEAGEGLYTTQHTLIWRRHDGRFQTTGRAEYVANTTLVGGGRLVGGEARVEWCE